MKKVIIFFLAVAIVGTIPVYAGEEDLIARIEMLEERIARLEELLEDGSQAKSETAAAEESVTLGVGTWLVGEDIHAGRYNLTSGTDAGSICTIYKSLDEKLDGGFMTDFYSVTTETYLESAKDIFDSSILDGMQTEIFNVYLQDGQCLEIEGSPMIFTPS